MFNIDDVKKVCFSDNHMLKIKNQISKNGMLDFLISEYNFFENFGISQIIYHLKNDIYQPVTCKVCEKKVRYVNINIGYVKYCSNKCQSNDYWRNVSDDEIEYKISKTKKTCLERYGVDNPLKVDEFKDRSKKTNLIKYGAEHHLKTQKSKDNMVSIIKSKYGVDNVSQYHIVKEKKKKKSISRSEEEKRYTRDKYRTTILERYGVEHLSQDSDFLDQVLKKSFSYKSHRLPSGKVISLQGYEPQVLDFLLKEYDESDILYTNKSIENKIGKIFYHNCGKKSRYFPDMYIISKNKIVEVKSTFTYTLDLDKNLLKMEECKKRGIDFQFIIYDNINNDFIIL